MTRAAAKRVAYVEVGAIVTLVLAIVWGVKPLGAKALDLLLRALVAGLLVGSAWIHGDSRKRLGLRFDNLVPALARLFWPSLIVVVGSLLTGALLGSIRAPRYPLPGELAYYFVWAFAQQYALQAVVLLRLEDAGLGTRAPLVAAILFSSIHAPNPGLMTLTFLGGWLWCSTFRRQPNLIAVALGHACIAVTIVSALPREVTGGFQIGLSYLRGR